MDRIDPSQGINAPGARKNAPRAAARLKIVSKAESDAAPRKILRLHTSTRAEAGLAYFKEAAASLGMTVLPISPLGISSGARSAVATDLMAVHLVGTGAHCLSELAIHVRSHPKLSFVVLGEDDDPALVDACHRAGALGFIPTRYSAAAMRAALTIVLEGEVYRPTAQVGPEGRPAPLATHSLGSGANSEAGIQDYRLTKVEREVLVLAAKGMTNHEIAQRRGGREGTIKVHMNHIFSKLSVRSRCEAIAVYLHMHNVDPEELHQAEAGIMDLKWLLATMTHQHCRKNTVLFRRGDAGEKIYYLQHGIVSLKEIGVEMVPTDLFGEIGVFAPEHKRTCTAVCKTDVDLFTLSFEEVRRCYFLNPQFAFYIMYLITRRLMADRERFRNSIR